MAGGSSSTPNLALCSEARRTASPCSRADIYTSYTVAAEVRSGRTIHSRSWRQGCFCTRRSMPISTRQCRFKATTFGSLRSILRCRRQILFSGCENLSLPFSFNEGSEAKAAAARRVASAEAPTGALFWFCCVCEARPSALVRRGAPLWRGKLTAEIVERF